MNVSVRIFNPTQTMRRICDNDRTRIFLAETCARYMDKFVPMDKGKLSKDYTCDPGKVIYSTVYARRQFYGTNFNFSRDMHPNATARWDKAVSPYKRQIANEVSIFIGRL